MVRAMAEREEGMVLTRLAARAPGGGAPFLAAHHLAAAERLERLIRRSRIVPRLTMSYDAARVGGRERSGNGVETASEAAATARRQLSRIAAALPTDCWGILFDVCAMDKGLQEIETERQWPRRSAKLVLRIALDQLAACFGLSPHAQGHQGAINRHWLEARPSLFPADAVDGPSRA
jgi:hypothetical protein